MVEKSAGQAQRTQGFKVFPVCEDRARGKALRGKKYRVARLAQRAQIFRGISDADKVRTVQNVVIVGFGALILRVRHGGKAIALCSRPPIKRLNFRAPQTLECQTMFSGGTMPICSYHSLAQRL